MEHGDYVARPREQRRQKKTRAQLAAERPKPRKTRPKLQKLILRGLNGDAQGGAIPASLAWDARAMDDSQLAAARRLVLQFASTMPGICTAPVLTALVRLAPVRSQWVRPIEAWERPPRVRDGAEIAWSLATHLLAEYPVPRWMIWAWVGQDAHSKACRAWFIHVGAGKNFRDAPLLPLPLTKLMAHHATLAPPEFRPIQALRFGQFAGGGLTAHHAAAVANTRLRDVQRDEGFWSTFVPWLKQNARNAMQGVGAIVDFVHAMKFGQFGPPAQPDFDFSDWQAFPLVHAAVHWQAQQARWLDPRGLRWKSCGIGGLTIPMPRSPAKPEVQIVELVTPRQLIEEGQALDHCVAQYADQAAAGTSAIFSLRRRQEGVMTPSTTIEVLLSTRTIVQARTHENLVPSAEDLEIVHQWAALRGLVCAYDD